MCAGRSKTLEQCLIFKRFRQEFHGARSHHLHAYFRVTVRRYKDRRNPAVVRIQLGCDSRPDIPGMRMSVISQAVLREILCLERFL